MEEILHKILYITIFGVVIVAILLGLRGTALGSAYDASKAFTINDSAGVVHNVAASGISGDTVATIYALLAGLVTLAVVTADIFLVLQLMKTK